MNNEGPYATIRHCTHCGTIVVEEICFDVARRVEHGYEDCPTCGEELEPSAKKIFVGGWITRRNV